VIRKRRRRVIRSVGAIIKRRSGAIKSVESDKKA
jgi:hypothetical protein